MLRGTFIGVKEDADTFVLEQVFCAHAGQAAMLRVTALGLYAAQINGVRVGDAYLAPGWTSYHKTLQVQEYDVTALVREGENTLTLAVNEGWCCGPLAWDGRRVYGYRPAVCADLLLDGAPALSTDTGWRARESYIRSSGIYAGETQDFTAECRPLTPVVISYDKAALVPQMCEPVRTVGRVAVKEVIRTPKGELVYDFGQDLVGVAEVKTPASFDGTLTLQFAEILVGGNFYTDNLRSAKATDTFTLRGAKTLSPEFTFHGFRYMKLEGAELPAESVTALVRHSDLRRTGFLETGDARFDRLYQNVIWGQRGNFVDLPTDCPQRDERLGWTGDINVFCTTAAYNYDIRAFMKKWLRTLRDDQGADGKIPHVAPDILNERTTAAMWCDAVTMVPWKLYAMYGDISFLEENYEAMKAFIAAREGNMEDGLVAHGFEYGDWLALDKEQLIAESPFGRTDVYYTADVLQTESLRIVAETARLLGRADEAAAYVQKRERLLARMRDEFFTAGGRLAFDTVTAQALALYFGIVPEAHRAKLAAQLNENVKQHGYRTVTGFIGTPHLLFALADNGYFEAAERLLLNSDFPGWLYEVDMGATTVWERWNSLLPDGTPNPDGMNSYNHYAYGSVMEFVYRRIAGIEAAEAGFAKIRVAPHPCKGLPSLRAEYDSVRGKIASRYERTGGKIVYTVALPAGAAAEIVLPGEAPLAVTGGVHTFERAADAE